MPRASESGFPIPPLYGPDDVADGLAERLGAPGEYPYTRGVYASMYTGSSES
jgi:methylmalonyl-CoA mutase N-terminal domain/subunit